MEKANFKSLVKSLVQAKPGVVSEVNVPKMKFLMVDGQGMPESAAFQAAVPSLYSIAFTIKFMPKKGILPHGYFEYSVPPLEGLYSELEKGWKWTLMIAQPDFVTDEVIEQAKAMLAERKKPVPEHVRLESLDEGLSCQILHMGPYSTEPASVELVHKYIAEHDYEIAGRHHEVYLNDPRRVAPEKIKTVIRYPVRSE